jgi:hypothetical protein
MDDILNHGWFTLELAWHRIKYELDDHIVLPVLLGTIIIILLVRIFLTPSVTKKG